MVGQFLGDGAGYWFYSQCEGPWERLKGQEGCGTGFVPFQGDSQCPGLLPGSNLIDALVFLKNSGSVS